MGNPFAGTVQDPHTLPSRALERHCTSEARVELDPATVQTRTQDPHMRGA